MTRDSVQKVLVIAILGLTTAAIADAPSDKSHGPDCSGSWPTTMALVHMKNAGLLDGKDLDGSKTKTVRIASEKTGKDLWHQVYDVKFLKKSGEPLEAIAIHDASLEECSMSGVEVLVVSKHLNPEGK